MHPEHSEGPHPIKLDRLQAFHRAMLRAEVERAVFSYQVKTARLQVVFIVSESPFVLLIAVQGLKPFAFEVPVLRGYRVVPFLGSNAKPLWDALGLEFDPANRFSASGFFRELNSKVPEALTLVREAQPHELAVRDRDYEDPDKPYFVGWIAHSDGRRVTRENLTKTRELLGPACHARCEQDNISSRWTADPSARVNATRPPRRTDGTGTSSQVSVTD